jgi:hypothetical protein
VTATEFLRNLLKFKLARATDAEKARLESLLHGEWLPSRVLEALKAKDPQ